MISRSTLMVLLVCFVATLAMTANGTAKSTAALSPAPGDQTAPAIVFNGANYLVVWADAPLPYAWQISGTRVSPSGEVLDSGGIAIWGSGVPESAVASDGSNSLVVWDTGGSETDIYGARVTRAGGVLDVAGIPITTASGWQRSPAVAFDGTNYLVAWVVNPQNRGGEIHAARVTQAGAVLDPGGIRIHSTGPGADTRSPAIAFDGSNYLVAWTVGAYSGLSDLYGARVSPAGTVLDPDGFIISGAPGHQGTPVMSFDGANYLIAWTDNRHVSSSIYGTRVSPAGNVLDPEGIEIAAGAGGSWLPTVAFDGTNYLVAWADSGCCSIYGTRLTPAGIVLDRDGFAIASGDNQRVRPRAAFDGTNYFVAWSERSGLYDIYGARVTPSGQVLDPRGVLLSTAKSPPRRRCVVPRVIGRTLTGATARIRRGRCRPGRVRRVRSARMRGRVISQSPRAGVRRPKGTSVNLVIGRR